MSSDSAILSTLVLFAPSVASCAGVLAAVTSATVSGDSTAASVESFVAAGVGVWSDVEGTLVGTFAAEVAAVFF